MSRYKAFWQQVLEYYLEYVQQFNSITGTADERFRNQLWMKQQLAVKQRLDALSELHHKLTDEIALQNFSDIDQKLLYDHLQHIHLPVQQAGGFHALVSEVWRTLGWMEYEIPEPDEDDFSAILAKVSGCANDMLRSIFQQLPWSSAIHNLAGLTKRIAEHIESKLGALESISYYSHIFYRNQHAYLMAVAHNPKQSSAFILPFIQTPHGITCDAVIMGEQDMIQVFSFSRSYFQVVCEHPFQLINFLNHWMPAKSKAQLFINLGYADWGKHLLLRDLLIHRNSTHEMFDFAPGIRGLVMIVFTLPKSNLVLKVIRDTPKPPKENTKEDVITKYNLVATSDRAGRVADAQRYARIDLPAEFFSTELLTELLNQAPSSCQRRGDVIILSDIYLERKLIPMNIYITQQPEIADKIILDYGRAIEEMASTNLFPGDLLIKNFGISQEQRVIFYDYDEVCRVTECEFLSLPKNWEEEGVVQNMVVYPHQVFPEEFPKFLLPIHQRKVLVEQFPHLFTPLYWKQLQQNLGNLFVKDHAPYLPNLP